MNVIPNYVKEIARRMRPVLIEYKDEEGTSYLVYTYCLKARWRCGYESQLVADSKKLVEWASRNGAYAKVISYEKWSDIDGMSYSKAIRSGFHNRAYLVVSDPVANVLEKYMNQPVSMGRTTDERV